MLRIATTYVNSIILANFLFRHHSIKIISNNIAVQNTSIQSCSLPVRLTAYGHDDLELLSSFGLKSMQNARIFRNIEEALYQGTYLTYQHLCTHYPLPQKMCSFVENVPGAAIFSEITKSSIFNIDFIWEKNALENARKQSRKSLDGTCSWYEKEEIFEDYVAFGSTQEHYVFCSEKCQRSFRKQYPSRIHRNCYETRSFPFHAFVTLNINL